MLCNRPTCTETGAALALPGTLQERDTPAPPRAGVVTLPLPIRLRSCAGRAAGPTPAAEPQPGSHREPGARESQYPDILAMFVAGTISGDFCEHAVVRAPAQSRADIVCHPGWSLLIQGDVNCRQRQRCARMRSIRSGNAFWVLTALNSSQFNDSRTNRHVGGIVRMGWRPSQPLWRIPTLRPRPSVLAREWRE